MLSFIFMGFGTQIPHIFDKTIGVRFKLHARHLFLNGSFLFTGQSLKKLIGVVASFVESIFYAHLSMIRRTVWTFYPKLLPWQETTTLQFNETLVILHLLRLLTV